MKNRSANLLLFILVGCFLMTAQIARAQQTSLDNSRNALTDANCRVLITVTGAVRVPSRFEMRRQVRLLEVLALVGGTNEHAGKTVQIIHSTPGSDCESWAFDLLHGKSEGVETYNLTDVWRGDEKANPFLQPGDKVLVDSDPEVYVVGNVMAPRALALKGPLTVTQAITMAGGVLPGSITNRVRIIHLSTDGSSPAPKIIVDLKAIQKGRDEDVALQPYDIVEVPGKGDHPSPFKGLRLELPLRVIY